MTTDKRLKGIETELAYLRKEIEKLIEIKPVEIHYHYSYDYKKIKDLVDYFKQQIKQ